MNGSLNQYDEGFVESGFDAVAETYHEVAFLRGAAQVLVESVTGSPAARALDIATGPGTTALLLAAQRGADVEVVGIDISPQMIEVAQRRARQQGAAQVRFRTASALELPFDDHTFDLVLCSSAIYYMPDLLAALCDWKRVLRPGGTLAFSTFGAGVLEPMSSLFDARIRAHGIVVPQPTPLFRLNAAAAGRELLERAGMSDAQVVERQVGYWVRDEDTWWTMLMSTGFQALVAALDVDARVDFEREHRREVRAHVGPAGLWVDVPVIAARAMTRQT